LALVRALQEFFVIQFAALSIRGCGRDMHHAAFFNGHALVENPSGDIS
jgi:hypothetical protein